MRSCFQQDRRRTFGSLNVGKSHRTSTSLSMRKEPWCMQPHLFLRSSRWRLSCSTVRIHDRERNWGRLSSASSPWAWLLASSSLWVRSEAEGKGKSMLVTSTAKNRSHESTASLVTYSIDRFRSYWKVWLTGTRHMSNQDDVRWLSSMKASVIWMSTVYETLLRMPSSNSPTSIHLSMHSISPRFCVRKASISMKFTMPVFERTMNRSTRKKWDLRCRSFVHQDREINLLEQSRFNSGQDENLRSVRHIQRTNESSHCHRSSRKTR